MSAALTPDETALYTTIQEEVCLLRTLYAHKEQLTSDFVRVWTQNPIKKVYFSGQASGMFLGEMLSYFIEHILQAEVTVMNPADYPHYTSFNVNNCYEGREQIMLCPAHSGTTIGPIRMAEECQRQKIPVICTTIDPHSPLASRSTVVIDKLCGREESFIETKTHMASLMIFFLCLVETAKQQKRLDDAAYAYYQNYFTQLPTHIEQILTDTSAWFHQHSDIVTNAAMARYIGAGPYYALAKEGGLKIAEAASIASLPYEVEEFMHTGTTQITSDTLFFLIVPRHVKETRMSKLIEWCRMYSQKVILVAHYDHPCRDSLSLLSDFLDDEYLSVMEYMVCFQLLASLFADKKGYSVIHARNDGASAYLKTHVEEG